MSALADCLFSFWWWCASSRDANISKKKISHLNRHHSGNHNITFSMINSFDPCHIHGPWVTWHETILVLPIWNDFFLERVEEKLWKTTSIHLRYVHTSIHNFYLCKFMSEIRTLENKGLLTGIWWQTPLIKVFLNTDKFSHLIGQDNKIRSKPQISHLDRNTDYYSLSMLENKAQGC